MPRRAKAERRPPGHLVDTNVLLRYLVGDDPAKAARATALMERVERAEETILITDEVLTETVWTLQRYYKVPRTEIVARLTAVLSFAGAQVSSKQVIVQALQFFESTSADFVDCFLGARGNVKGIPVYTFDETDFKKLPAAWEKP